MPSRFHTAASTARFQSSATDDIKKAISNLRSASANLAVAMESLDQDSDTYKALDAIYNQNRSAIEALQLCK